MNELMIAAFQDELEKIAGGEGAKFLRLLNTGIRKGKPPRNLVITPENAPYLMGPAGKAWMQQKTPQALGLIQRFQARAARRGLNIEPPDSLHGETVNSLLSKATKALKGTKYPGA